MAEELRAKFEITLPKRMPKKRSNLEVMTAVGELVFGKFWGREMSRRLGVTPRHMVRFTNGETPVPDILQDGTKLSDILNALMLEHIDKYKSVAMTLLSMNAAENDDTE